MKEIKDKYCHNQNEWKCLRPSKHWSYHGISFDLHNYNIGFTFFFVTTQSTCIFQILTNIWLSAWTEDKPINGTYERSQALYRVSVYGYLGIGQGNLQHLVLIS